MSTPSSIEIPPARVYETRQQSAKDHSQSPMSSSSSSTYSSSPQTPSSANSSVNCSSKPSQKQKQKQKQKAVHRHRRRPSLLSPAFSEAETRTINLNEGEDGVPPRLIHYVSSSQGFLWNPELFLRSYVDPESYDNPIEHRREPVMEIRVTKDERRKWLSDEQH